LLDTWKIGIETLPFLALTGLSSESALECIKSAVSRELARDRFVVTLGGEHTVTLPAIRAHLGIYPNLHVLQIDAHLDLREEYEGNPLSHACVMRRLHDLAVPFTQVGIRSFSREEWMFVQEKGLAPFTIFEIRKDPLWQEKVLDRLTGPVYISFDVDGLDPSIMPATGTPEPDGLSWEQATGLLARVAASKKIIGMDLVEFAPNPYARHAAFTLAKLVYRVLGYIFQSQLLGLPN